MIRLALVRQRYNVYGSAERYLGRALAALGANGTVDVTLIARRWDDDAGWHTRRIDPFSLTRIGRDRIFAREAAACFGEYDLVQSDERIAGAAIYRAIDGVHAARMEQVARLREGRSKLAPRLSHYDRHLLAAEADTLRHPALRCVLCNSQRVAADVAERFGIEAERIALVYNAVDAALYNPDLVRHRSA
jgi:UDP-glucose:(heptosyl)LPS alpha-1,3-glucosyltransferase